jgi:hypothetical protein
MARLIPNENTRVFFLLALADEDLNPTVAEIGTDGVELTDFLVTLDASTTGNTVPTPSFASLFETSISGTVTATFTAEFYRDDEDDLAWETLPRATDGFFVVSRFGFAGDDPVADDLVEVWPVRITSRSPMALTNNEVQRFGVEAAIPQEPNEDAVVLAAVTPPE